MPFALKGLVESTTVAPKPPTKKRKKSEDKTTPSTPSNGKRDKSRLASTTPEQLKRAVERRRIASERKKTLQREQQDVGNIAELVYSSTQETISVTPDPLARSLRRSRRIEAATEQIAESLAHKKRSRPPITPEAPKIDTEGDAENWHRGSSPPADVSSGHTRTHGLPSDHLEGLYAQSDASSPILDSQQYPSQPQLPSVESSTSRISNLPLSSTPIEEYLYTRITDSNSSTELPSQKESFIPSSIEHTAADHSVLLRSKLAKWLEDGPLDADQIADLVHSSADEHELPVHLFVPSDRKVMQSIVPKTRYRSSLRDTIRRLSKKFMVDEMMKRTDFITWLHSARRDDLELFWSVLREHPKYVDTSERKLRQILQDIYPEQWPPAGLVVSALPTQVNDQLQHGGPHIGASAAANETPPENFHRDPSEALDISSLQAVDEPHELSELGPVSNETASVGIERPRLTSNHRSGSFQIACYQMPKVVEVLSNQGQATDQVTCISVNSQPRDTIEAEDQASTVRIPCSQMTSEEEEQPVEEQSLDLSSEGTNSSDTNIAMNERFVPFEDEKRWKAHAVENPDMVYKTGRLSETEKARVAKAVHDFMKHRGSTIEDFCASVHSGDRKATKFFWSSLIYCLLDRKPKNLREYIKKAYPIHDRSPFTRRELVQLRQLVGVHGKCWATIGKVMNHWREDCQQEYARLKGREATNVNDGPWSPEELYAFERAVSKFGTEPVSWRAVAEAVGTRTIKQCHDHGRIPHRTDASYLSRPSASSTPVRSSKSINTQRIPSRVPRSSMRARQEPDRVVPPAPEMNYADKVAVIDYLIALPLESLDRFELPENLERFAVFGYDQIRAKVSLLRKQIKKWRRTSTSQTLLEIRQSLLNNKPRDSPSQEI